MKYKYTLRQIKAICALHGWTIHAWEFEKSSDGNGYIDVMDWPNGEGHIWRYTDVVHSSFRDTIRAGLRALHRWAEAGFIDKRIPKGEIT